MSKEVVRNMAMHTTHLAHVSQTTAARQSGRVYRKPDPEETRAFCGALIDDGVVLLPKTKVHCQTCRILNGHHYGGDHE